MNRATMQRLKARKRRRAGRWRPRSNSARLAIRQRRHWQFRLTLRGVALTLPLMDDSGLRRYFAELNLRTRDQILFDMSLDA